MSASATCPQCGASVKDAAKGLCPRCLVELGLALNAVPQPLLTDTGKQAESDIPAGQVSRREFNRPEENAVEPATSATLLRRIGDYELLEEIARGGMGVVYKARQLSLNRVVALKMILSGELASRQMVLRFRAEAEAAAHLRHPHIVTIYETGESEGQHYFSMEYIEGRNLAELAHGRPLPAKRAARYVQKITAAIHYAHGQRVLHRDLKPSNVLIDENDEPRITDFGLAKDLARDSELTVTGQLLGSPNFMPPEQAVPRRGKVGPQSDVYAIGAILYYLLTGRPPFQAEALTDTLAQLVSVEPVAPRLLNPSVPRDLETICLKCLEKDVPRRYPSAQALADELDRFLRGEPVLARPIGPAGKAWRWCRRNPRLASVTGVALLSLVLGLAGVTWQWRRAEAQRQRAEASEYVLAMNAAEQALNAKNPALAIALLDRHRPSDHSPLATDLRGFEWRYLWQQCQNEAEAVVGSLQSAIRSLEVSPDGQWLFAGSDGGEAKMCSLATSEEIPLVAKRSIATYGAFTPDGRFLLFSDQGPQDFGAIAVWDIQSRKRLAPITDTDGRPLGPMAFSPDGRWFGFGVAHPPEGKRFVLLDFPSRKKAREVIFLTKNLDSLKGRGCVFTADSRSVIVTETEPDCRIVFCNLVAGSKPQYFPGHREGITAMAISPDGRMLATGAGYTDHDIRLWEVPSFRSLGELSGHAGWMTALKFSPDGQTLASASADQTIRFWDVPTRKSRRMIRGLTGDVGCLCFAPDGQKLFSGASDGTIQRWSAGADPTQPVLSFWRQQAGFESLAIGPNGLQFAGIRQGLIYQGDARGAAIPRQIQELGTTNTCLLFSADGRTLLSGTWTGDLQVWSLDGRQAVRRLSGSSDPVGWLGQDASGSILVAVHWKSGVRFQLDRPHTVGVWNTAVWRQQKSLAIPGIGASYAVSPAGRWLATGDKAGNLQLWSLTGRSETNTLSFPGGIRGIAFSPDGKLLTAAGTDGTVKAWELPALHELAPFRARSHALLALAFSPDSQRLALAGEGKEALRLWDVVTWQELITWERPGESLHQIAFSGDGNQLTAGNSQGDVLVWRAPSWTQIEAKDTHKKVP